MSEKLSQWFKANGRRVIPIVILGAIAIFFIWRAVTLGDWFHIGAAIVFSIGAILVALGKLGGSVQSNLLNIGISLFFLDLVFAQLNLIEVMGVLAGAKWWMLLPSLAALMCHLVVRIWRWQWLLKPVGDVSFWPAFRAGMIGIGGNMVLPARAGEFLRAYAVGKETGISKTGAFATVVLERIFDGLTVLLFLILLIVFGADNPMLRQFGMAGGAFFGLALLGVVAFIIWRPWFEKIIARILPDSISEKALGLLDAFASGLDSLRNFKMLSMVSLLSIITWIFIPLSFWPVFLAFDFGVPVPLFIAILAVPMVALALTIPGAPGGLGTFEWAAALAVTIGFQMVGTPLAEDQQAIVAASAVLLHISQSVPEALIGLWAFLAAGLTTSDLQAGREL